MTTPNIGRRFVDCDELMKTMSESIDQRVESLHTNLVYTPPELWNERFSELRLELKTHLLYNLTEAIERE